MAAAQERLSDERKKRIIDHVNRDHPDSVMRYLEHYCRSSYFSARNARLVDISLTHMTISASGTSNHVPFDPPLKAWDESRQRLVAMDKASTAALGRHPITVKKYRPPSRPLHFFMVFITSFALATLPRRANFLPGSLMYRYFIRWTPLQGLLLKTRWLIWWFIIAVHTIEASNMVRRLKKHSVPVFSQVWWAWVFATLSEGFTSFMRLSEVIEEEQRRQAKMQH